MGGVRYRFLSVGVRLHRDVPRPSQKFVFSVKQFKHKLCKQSSCDNRGNTLRQNSGMDSAMILHADGRKEQGGMLMSHLP